MDGAFLPLPGAGSAPRPAGRWDRLLASLAPPAGAGGPIECEAVLFDLEDVLYDASDWRRWLLHLLCRLGLRTHPHVFFQVWRTDYLPAAWRGEEDYWQAMARFLAAGGLARGQIDELLVAARARRRTMDAAIRPFARVAETLARLSGCGHRLGVVVNTADSAGEVRARLDRLGIGQWLPVVVTSRDVGRLKPDPLPWQRALEQLGARPRTAAFVGHDAAELAGARRLGLSTVAFNCEPTAHADRCIDRFDELLRHVVRSKAALAA